MQPRKRTAAVLVIVSLALAPACSTVLDLQDVTAPACSDRVKNGDESDVDCGGSCAPCGDARSCSVAGDCGSGVCTASVCQTAACRDGTQNGDESDVDCGGTLCPGCPVDGVCEVDTDCAGGAICDAARCRDARSCLEIVQHRPGVASGVYRIAPAGGAAFDAVCDMDAGHDGGGWTLLLKASGDTTLGYNAPAWTSAELLDPTDLTTQPGNAKYPSFVALPVTILAGDLDGFRYRMAVDGRTAQQVFLNPDGNGGSLYTMGYPSFGSGPSWSTQPNCQVFGIDTPFGYARARFGWSANQENDCASNDTAIGLGLMNMDVDQHGAGYLCLATECSSGAMVNAGGNGLLWGR